MLMLKLLQFFFLTRNQNRAIFIKLILHLLAIRIIV